MAALSDAQAMTISVKASRSWLARAARDLTNRLDPTAAARKRERARRGRTVSVEHGADAMSWLTIYGPTARIQAVYQHLDDLAHHPHPTDPDGAAGADHSDPRGVDARRADIALDLLFGAGRGKKPDVPAVGAGSG
jgi:hypothetical protein